VFTLKREINALRYVIREISKLSVLTESPKS